MAQAGLDGEAKSLQGLLFLGVDSHPLEVVHGQQVMLSSSPGRAVPPKKLLAIHSSTSCKVGISTLRNCLLFPKAHLTACSLGIHAFRLNNFVLQKGSGQRGHLLSSRARYSQKRSIYHFGAYTTHALCAIHQVLTDSGCDKFKGPLPVVQTINLLWKHA